MRAIALALVIVAAAIPAQAASPDKTTICAIARTVKLEDCTIRTAVEYGLVKTGLVPVFPKGATCPKIDEAWAISYSAKRPTENYHGGIDIPMPWNAPIIAAAAGEVVAIFDGKNSYRGIEVILRHSPRDSGLADWTFTGYSHFNALPALKVGDRVRMGQVLGPTGNSGRSRSSLAQSTKRRPAIHFSVVYGPSPDFTVTRNGVVVPVGAKWADPTAWLNGTVGLESYRIRDLPAASKNVPVAVMLGDGTVQPQGARRIWPYACR
jgi:hypothetical protein